MLLIVLLAGIAFVLSTRTAAHLMDDSDYDGLLVAVWAFLAGGLYGGVAYWVLGGVLHWSSVILGSEGRSAAPGRCSPSPPSRSRSRSCCGR